MSNIAVIDYNGTFAFSGSLLTEGEWLGNEHCVFYKKCARKNEIASLIDSLDRKIDHVVLYAGSLRMDQWLKTAVKAFRHKFPACQFTVFHCECARRENLKLQARLNDIDLIHWYQCSHFIPREALKMLAEYQRFGLDTFFIRLVEDKDMWMYE